MSGKTRTYQQDYYFTIEENPNYEPGEGNLFLTCRQSGKCVGGVDRLVDGQWQTSIDYKSIEETESDSLILYTGKEREVAIEALWENRFQAHNH